MYDMDIVTEVQNVYCKSTSIHDDYISRVTGDKLVCDD